MVGGKVPLKANADAAVKKAPDIVQTMIVVKRTGGAIDWVNGRDVRYEDEVAKASTECAPAEMNAEDPLFILYTSGSTGAPKGVVHTTGGYLVYASMTHQYVFDYHDGDVYWCTADVGWVTGHSYIVYGPLANGATTLMFEGIPNYPIDVAVLGGDRQVQGQHLLYRADRDPFSHGRGRGAGQADQPGLAAAARHLSASRSIRKRGSGITAWSGIERCPIVDTWWQTETGGIMITPLAGRHRVEARFCDVSVLRCPAGGRGCQRHGAGRRLRRKPRHRRFLAGPDAHCLWRS